MATDPFQAVVVVNRRAITQEGMFDGRAIVFKPHEKKAYPPNVAFAIVDQSVLKTNLASGLKEVYALGIEGDPSFPTDPLEGDLATHNPVEQFDRRDVPRLTETEPKVLGQDGAEDLGVGKADKRVTPVPGESPFEGESTGGGTNPDAVVQPASADEVQAVSFKNDAVKKGTQRPGRSEHRVSNKPL